MQILREKSRAKSQVTFDEDFNVPDAKQDVGRLIQHKGRIIMEDVRLADGKGILRGDLQVDVLYVGEESGIISSLTAKLPFEETLNLKDIVNGAEVGNRVSYAPADPFQKAEYQSPGNFLCSCG